MLSSIRNNYVTLAIFDSTNNNLQELGETIREIDPDYKLEQKKSIHIEPITIKNLNKEVVEKIYKKEKIYIKPVKIRLPISQFNEPDLFYEVPNVENIRCINLIKDEDSFYKDFIIYGPTKEEDTYYFKSGINSRNNNKILANIAPLNDDCFNETLFEYIRFDIKLDYESKISDLKNLYDQLQLELDTINFHYASEDDVKKIQQYDKNIQNESFITLENINNPSEEFKQSFNKYISALKKAERKKEALSMLSRNGIPIKGKKENIPEENILNPCFYFIRK